jgi:hypothetical protein
MGPRAFVENAIADLLGDLLLPTRLRTLEITLQ